MAAKPLLVASWARFRLTLERKLNRMVIVLLCAILVVTTAILLSVSNLARAALKWAAILFGYGVAALVAACAFVAGPGIYNELHARLTLKRFMNR
jgi:hypothetical protein